MPYIYLVDIEMLKWSCIYLVWECFLMVLVQSRIHSNINKLSRQVQSRILRFSFDIEFEIIKYFA
jgi:uncharacterized protein (DUF1499 family)